MKYQIDQSGKVEDTSKLTIVAFANGKAKILKISARDQTQNVKVNELLERRDKQLLQIGNILHNTVPYGKDDSENVEVKKWGTPTEFKFTPKDHIDLAKSLDLIDFERGAKVGGSRAYFLKNKCRCLNPALPKKEKKQKTAGAKKQHLIQQLQPAVLHSQIRVQQLLQILDSPTRIQMLIQAEQIQVQLQQAQLLQQQQEA